MDLDAWRPMPLHEIRPQRIWLGRAHLVVVIAIAHGHDHVRGHGRVNRWLLLCRLLCIGTRQAESAEPRAHLGLEQRAARDALIELLDRLVHDALAAGV
jgi:hypothetical protein